MSRQSRARAAARVTTSAQASAAGSATPSPGPDPFFARWGALLAGGVIVLAALAAYHHSFSGPFIFDDQLAITDNPTIRQLGSALSPSASSTTAGRPVLNLTFALNYVLGGMNVWGYHAFNLLVHALAGLVLFGIVRRTLARPALSRRFGTNAVPLALAVAVIWVVHPIQTEAVTYISQRAESLMGLFYLLTLYCFIRGASATGERREAKGEKPEGTALALGSQLSTLSPKLWFPASVLGCFLGTMSKEMIATAPVMVLLYDRTFVAGSFREAWRLRWRYYLGLAFTWLLLAYLRIDLRQPSVGFSQGVTWWSYALTSCRSFVLYCELVFWPHPLVFYYGANFIQHVTEAVPYILVLAALLVGMAVALWRWPVIGFASAWFFLILAPTSSVVPLVLQPMAEHRLYLSLAAVVVMVVLGLYALLGRRSLVICVALSIVLGVLTIRRNEDYRSDLAIWSDNVAKCPDNPWAHLNEGKALLVMGRLTEAKDQLEIALRLKPDLAQIYNNLGVISDQSGRIDEAINDYIQALRFASNLVDTHYNLAVDLHRMGRLAEAIDQYGEVVKANPDDFMAQCGLGTALAEQGHLAEALARFKEIVRIFPESAEAHYNLGTAFIQLGRFTEALNEYKVAIQINPEYAEAHYNLGNTLVQLGRLPEAIGQYELTLRFKPDYADARKNLERAQKILAQSAAGSEK